MLNVHSQRCRIFGMQDTFANARNKGSGCSRAREDRISCAQNLNHIYRIDFTQTKPKGFSCLNFE